MTDRGDLLDEVLRLAAASGVEVEVAPHAAAARAAWSAAPLILVGADLVDGLAAAAPPRRRDVVVVGIDGDDAAIWRHAVGVSAEQVVLLPDGERWLVDRLADLAEGPSRHGLVLAVVAGRGGAGASTLATGLALAGVRAGHRALLVDADPLGGGLDLLLGGEEAAGLRWPDLADTRGRVGAAALDHALPALHGLAVLSWDRGELAAVPPDAMASLVDAGARGFALTVVDVPRALDDAAREALSRADVTALVVPAEVRGTAAAARVLEGVRAATSRVSVVVRRRPGATLDPDVVADALGLPLAGVLEDEPGLLGAADRGEPPGLRSRDSLARACDRLLAVLGRRPAAA